jgi:hypothetical protein
MDVGIAPRTQYGEVLLAILKRVCKVLSVEILESEALAAGNAGLVLHGLIPLDS